MRTLSLLVLGLLAGALSAQEFVHPNFRFSPPAGYTRSSEAEAATNAICVYHNNADDPQQRRLVLFEKLDINLPDRIDDPRKMMVFDPDLEVGDRWVMDWQDTSIAVVEGLVRGEAGIDRFGRLANTYDYVAIG